MCRLNGHMTDKSLLQLVPSPWPQPCGLMSYPSGDRGGHVRFVRAEGKLTQSKRRVSASFLRRTRRKNGGNPGVEFGELGFIGFTLGIHPDLVLGQSENQALNRSSISLSSKIRLMRSLVTSIFLYA